MVKEKKTKMKIVFKKKKNGGGKCFIAIQWKALQFENYNALLFISVTCFQLSLCLRFSLGCIDNEVLKRETRWKRETSYISCPLSFTRDSFPALLCK
jgi:hypothetical protein